MAKPLPPKLAPKPGQVKVYRAVFKYEAQYPDELSFDEGDLLYVTDRISNPDWWTAKCGGRKGLIPSNYVEENAESVDFPLHEAAKRGNLDWVEECLSNQVSVNGLDRAGSTPLHWAARGGHLHCLLRLLQVPQVQINVQNKLGDTALHLSAWRGHAETVASLLEHVARTGVVNRDGKMAAQLATDPATVALLQIPRSTKSMETPDQEYGDDDDSD